jgi:hypothetical protein
MQNVVQSFSDTWWENFIETNKNFTQACVLKQAINPSLVNELNKGIIEVLNNRYKLKHLGEGIRVYIEGKEQNNNFLLDLSKNPPLENEDVITYLNRTFDKKFGIIINSGEKHSDIINHKILQAIQPLIDNIGYPATGVEITIFIGNYGWTPLGIHQDHRGENVLHFHLGPGKKTMYVWEEEKYEKLTGSKFNNMDIEPLLEHADVYPFEEGDIFYMPWNNFHVGYSDELSVGITLWFNNPTKSIFSKKIINSFLYQHIATLEDIDIISPQKDYKANHNTFTDFIGTLNLEKTVLEMNTADFFNTLYKDFKLSLLSNGGWQCVPLSLESKDNYIVDEYDYLLNKNIISEAPFKIYHESKDDETLVIYTRGTKIEMKYHTELIAIIDKINSNEAQNTNKLLEKIATDWPIDAGLYFLSLIYNKRGFEILN